MILLLAHPPVIYQFLLPTRRESRVTDKGGETASSNRLPCFAIVFCEMLSALALALSATLSAPLPASVVAFWDMQSTLESAGVFSWVDAVRGYVLKQHNASNPVQLEQGDGVYGPRCATPSQSSRASRASTPR